MSLVNYLISRRGAVAAIIAALCTLIWFFVLCVVGSPLWFSVPFAIAIGILCACAYLLVATDDEGEW